MEPKTKEERDRILGSCYDTNKLIGEWMCVEPVTTHGRKWWPQYNNDWNKLMEVWYKFLGLRFKEPMQQFKHSEIKTTVGYAILYGDIKLAYQNLIEAINWYNLTKQ